MKSKIGIILLGLVLLGSITFAAMPAQARFKINQQLNDFLTELMQKLQAFNEQAPEDKVYAHFDKTLYKPGETIWFTAYVRDAETLKKSNKSDIVSVQLINPKGGIEKEYKVVAENGVAKGDFKIDENAVGGIYKVKVFTNWMLNDKDPATFIKELTVQKVILPRLKMKLDFMKKAYGAKDEVAAELTLNDNTNKPLANYDFTYVVNLAGKQLSKGKGQTGNEGEAMVKFTLPNVLKTNDGLLNIMIKYQGQTESISRSVPIILNNINIALYPEGGDLVAGLTSKVAFKAVNEFGKAADIEGVVVDSKGQTLTSFSSYHQGMGAFTLQPKEDETYTVKITRPAGVTNTFELPEAMSAGYGLEVRTIDADQIYMTVQSTLKEELYLVGNVRGHKYFATKVPVKKGDNQVTIPTKFFPIGVAHFTLFDSKGIERAERLAFVNKDKQIKIDIKTDKEKYLPREKVKMTIKVSDERGMPMPANLSISVVDDQLLSFADDKSSNILSWMLMESDIKGTVEEPNFYFDESEEKADLALDYLLMTAGWRRFTWEEIRQGKKQTITYNNEKAILSGTVKSSFDHKPLAGVEITLGNNLKVTTGADGKYTFESFTLAANMPLNLNKQDYYNTNNYINQYNNHYDLYLNPEPSLRQQLTGRLRKTANAVRPNMAKGNRAMPMDVEVELAFIDVNADMAMVDDAVPSMPPVIEEVPEEEVEEDLFFEVEELDEEPIEEEKVVENKKVEDQANKADFKNLKGKANRDELAEEKVIVANEAVKDRRAAPKMAMKREMAEFDRPARKPMPIQANLYHRAREFAAPIYDMDEPVEKRTDFRSTVYWNGNVEIDRKGKKVLEFYNSDAVTSFKITAEGFAADGMIGRAEKRFFTQLPFSLSAKLPVEVVTEDVIKIPLTLVNNTKKTISGELTYEYPKGLTPKSKLPNKIQLTAGQAKTQYLAFNVVQRGLADKLAIKFKSSGFNDAIERDLTIISKGFPASMAFSGEEKKKAYEFNLNNVVNGSIDAKVTAYPSAMSDMLSGLESMLREPHGCFEQTSSSTYPNILVLNYLQETGQAKPAITTKAKGLIERGYARLTSYESSGGGFEWFGGNPAHEGLTAYGLMEFVDMQKVVSFVDQTMIDRTTTWLMSRRDGMGKFKRNPRALHSFGLTDNETMSIYITWALTEAKFSDLQTEVDFAYAHAKKANQPYSLGLAANIMFNRGEEKKGQELLAQLFKIQDENGAWAHDPKHKSAPGSSGNALKIETAALASLAMMKSTNPDRMKLKSCTDFIKSKRSSYGGYSSTNSTVLALRALVEYAKFSKRTDESGTIEVYANGKKVKSLDYEKGHDKPIVIDGLAEYLKDGKNTVEVIYANTNTPLPYSVGVNYNTVLPKSSKDCVIGLTTKLSSKKIKVGETVRLTTELKNTTADGQPMTIAIVGLPAGLSAQPWQLKELLDKKTFDFYEVIGNNLVLYYRQMKPSETRTINLDLKADIAGSYDAPASSAYLYYTDEHKVWTALDRVEILAN